MKIESAFREKISKGEKPRRQASMMAITMRVAVMTKLGQALSAH
jgi:hypothetical protein